MFKRILIANRGEIAVRVVRACRELGIASIAVYADDDRDALHVRLADEAYGLGAGALRDNYLNGEKILDVARQAGVQAVHPGYGFLSENAGFAGACGARGVVFVGPRPEVIAAMGLKVEARRRMAAAGVPVVPGSGAAVTSVEEVRVFAEHHGYPVAIKASAGGGGKGLRVVAERKQIKDQLEGAQREALSYFGDATVYLERYLPAPRHVEVQVLGDHHGNLIHLGDRDCSLQRRHQKVLEECPAPNLPEAVRRRLWDAAVVGARAIGYTNAGTLEFLVQGEDVYFLEVNTRLQVEHPVTELVTGLDLVQAQIRVAAGEPLRWRQEDVAFRGHAVECRINAEDPARGFMPSSGLVTGYEPPGGPGIRVDGAAYPGWHLPATYDSLIAKLVAWGPDRPAALARMRRALVEYRIAGITSNIAFHQWLLDRPEVDGGRYDTGLIGRDYRPPAPAALAPGPVAAEEPAAPAREFAVEVNERLFRVKVMDLAPPAAAGPDKGARPRRGAGPARGPAANGDKVVRAPLSGAIVRIDARPGAAVAAGETLMVLEAMKMENDIHALAAGKIKAVPVAVGDRVSVGAVLAVFE